MIELKIHVPAPGTWQERHIADGQHLAADRNIAPQPRLAWEKTLAVAV